MYARKPRAFVPPALLLTAVAIVMGLASCGDCDTGCPLPPVAVIGQIVDEVTGRPVGGARVEMFLQNGTSLSAPVGATTRGDGTFELTLPSPGPDRKLVTLRVASAAGPPYVVPDVEVKPTINFGDATVLGLWVNAHPVFPEVVVVTLNGFGVPGVDVEFKRTGGRQILSGSVPVGSVTVQTGSDGFAYPLRGFTTDTCGDVVGDLTIHLPPPALPLVLKAQRFPAISRYNPEPAFFVVKADSVYQ